MTTELLTYYNLTERRSVATSPSPVPHAPVNPNQAQGHILHTENRLSKLDASYKPGISLLATGTDKRRMRREYQ